TLTWVFPRLAGSWTRPGSFSSSSASCAPCQRSLPTAFAGPDSGARTPSVTVPGSELDAPPDELHPAKPNAARLPTAASTAAVLLRGGPADQPPQLPRQSTQHPPPQQRGIPPERSPRCPGFAHPLFGQCLSSCDSGCHTPTAMPEDCPEPAPPR